MPRHRGVYDPLNSAPYELSRSRIENFVRCPACFYMQQAEGIKFPDIPGFNINEATDVLLKKHFDKHPADVRKVVNSCAASTQTFVYRKAAALETELLDVIKAAGVQVNTADNAAFIKGSKAVYDEFASSVEGGAELVKQVQSLAN